jgi:hypothetical protein
MQKCGFRPGGIAPPCYRKTGRGTGVPNYIIENAKINCNMCRMININGTPCHLRGYEGED